MKKSLICLVLLLLLAFTLSASAQTAIPPVPTNNIYVQDYAGVLSDEVKTQIMSTSIELANKTKAQLVVVTINTLDGAPIDTYALELLRQWGIGDQRLNNGVLLLVAVNDRRSRIEVGYGLEGALNDAKTGQIQDTYMLPYFRQNDYNTGILQGYLALANEIASEYNVQLLAQPDAPPVEAQEQGSPLSPLMLLFIIGFFILDLMFFGGRFTTLLLLLFRNGGGGRGGGGGYGGGFGGGSGGGGGSSRSW